MLYYYLCAIYTLISAAVSFGFSVEAYLAAKVQNDAARINAQYAIARSLALLLPVIALVIVISKTALILLAVIMICVQLFDGVVGIRINMFKTVGPVLTALGNAIFLVLYLI